MQVSKRKPALHQNQFPESAPVIQTVSCNASNHKNANRDSCCKPSQGAPQTMPMSIFTQICNLKPTKSQSPQMHADIFPCNKFALKTFPIANPAPNAFQYLPFLPICNPTPHNRKAMFTHHAQAHVKTFSVANSQNTSQLKFSNAKRDYIF